MRYYVVRPTNALSVAKCHEHDFGVLLSPISMSKSGKMSDISQSVHPLPGREVVLDNGAYPLWGHGVVDHDFAPFARLIRRLGPRARWVAAPDRVAAGPVSLKTSLEWIRRARDSGLLAMTNGVVIPVQDGMTVDDLRPHIGRHVGIFVGGTREWKWRTVHEWAELAIEARSWTHVGRVNSRKRSQLCADLGIQSCDGGNVTRYSCNARFFVDASDGDETGWWEDRGRVLYVAQHTIAERRFRLTLGDRW